MGMINSAVMLQVAVSMTSYVTKNYINTQGMGKNYKIGGVRDRSMIRTFVSNAEERNINVIESFISPLHSASCPDPGPGSLSVESDVAEKEIVTRADNNTMQTNCTQNQNESQRSQDAAIEFAQITAQGEHNKGQESNQVQDPCAYIPTLPPSEGWKWFDEISMKCNRVVITQKSLGGEASSGRVLESGPEFDGHFTDCLLIDEKDCIACRVIRFMVYMGFMKVL